MTLCKIESFEQDSVCLIAQDQSLHLWGAFDSTRNAINLLNDIKAHSVIGIVGDYDLETLAFFLACVDKGFLITPLSASLAPQDSIFSSMLQSCIKEGQIDYLFITTHCILRITQTRNIVLSLPYRQNHTSGLILFSSGSTGKPKAVVYNLNTLLESYCHKRQNPLRIMSVYLPDHIAGIDVMRVVEALLSQKSEVHSGF